MLQPIQLPTPQFAVWARRAGIRLPYPVDITGVPGAGVTPPDAASPILRRLAEIAAAPRVSAFAMRSHPDGTTDCYTALAADRNAVLIITDADGVRVSEIGETELALSVVDALPALDPFRLDPVELPETDWQGLSEVVERTGEQDAVAAHFAEAGLPLTLAATMVLAAKAPVVIGVFGSSAWTDGDQRLGPRLAAWHEYEAGAVLSERVPQRGRGAQQIQVCSFSAEAAVRALAATVGDAVNAAAAKDPAGDIGGDFGNIGGNIDNVGVARGAHDR